MRPEVTNKNLHLLLPGKIVAAVEHDVANSGKSPLDALRAFYGSQTYAQLENEETKLWHYGPVALYEEFREKN